MGDSSFEEERTVTFERWKELYEKASKADLWGQMVEATEAYERTASTIEDELASVRPTRFEREMIEDVIACVLSRSKCLSSSDADENPSKDDMQYLLQVLDMVFTGGLKRFPLDTSNFSRKSTRASDELDNDDMDRRRSTDSDGGTGESKQNVSGMAEPKPGTLLPPLNVKPDQTAITIHIQKIGLKDASEYIQPHMSVFVYDGGVCQIGPTQETPEFTHITHTEAICNSTVHLQTTLEDIKDQNCAVFFEFRHYKVKKKKMSVRCWCMLELDELTEGEKVLEIYAKPTDPRRKKIRLHSVKALYLHLDIELYRPHNRSYRK